MSSHGHHLCSFSHRVLQLKKKPLHRQEVAKVNGSTVVTSLCLRSGVVGSLSALFSTPGKITVHSHLISAYNCIV